MIERVLVPMDDSDLSERALRYALEAHPAAAVTVLHVVGEPSGMMGAAASLALEGDAEQAGEDASEDLFSRARDVAEEYDATVETEVGWGSPAKEIVRRAEEFDAVLIGAHTGGVAERLFVGNVAKSVVHNAPVPVTVVR
ncbi:universal stress protein [Halobaculum halobium]|uniref:Universal stress protein n=1 Tax=Halobaculum halobium TaxID=3032281 RepID=A0ABD5T9M7_9EURY|nr:universal stress protein [Halobaculum sp. SYNS20]